MVVVVVKGEVENFGKDADSWNEGGTQMSAEHCSAGARSSEISFVDPVHSSIMSRGSEAI